MRTPIKMGIDYGESECLQCLQPLQSSGLPLMLVPSRWNPIFTSRRDLDYSDENKPYIEDRSELCEENDQDEEIEETREDFDSEESVIRTFMRGRNDKNYCLPQADKVEAFCFGADLGSLQADSGKGSEATIAWLDERCLSDPTAPARMNRGPLTAQNLYKELKKPVRFISSRSLFKQDGNSTDTNATVRSVAFLNQPKSNE
jgi:hypothetical protein